MSEQAQDGFPSIGALARSCLLLTAALLAVFPLFAWFGFEHHSWAGVAAAAVAGLVSGVGAVAALLLAGISKGTPLAVQATLLGTFSRTGLPLLVGLLLQQAGGELARAGVFGMILCYYLVALIAETVLSVRFIGGWKGMAAKA